MQPACDFLENLYVFDLIEGGSLSQNHQIVSYNHLISTVSIWHTIYNCSMQFGMKLPQTVNIMELDLLSQFQNEVI